jgi:cbb3-type cytochrome oxidase subunit 3
MKLGEFPRFLGSHLRIYWGLWAGLLGFVYLIYKLNSPVSDLFRNWLIGHARPDKGSVFIDGWPPALLSAFCFAVLTLAGLSIFTIVMAFRQGKKGGHDAARARLLLKTFHRTVGASDLIAKKLFPLPARPIKKVTRCKQVFSIFDEGDCHHVEELVLCAKDRDIHFIERRMEADPGGDSVEFTEEIDLKVESGTVEKGIQYLISKNEPRSKSILVFFLPVVRSGGADQRLAKTSFYWSGLMRRLVEQGEEEFENQVKSVDAVPLVEYEFWVKPRLGRLRCTNLGPEVDAVIEEKLEETEDGKGMHGWRYTGKNLPGDHVTRLRLELQKD